MTPLAKGFPALVLALEKEQREEEGVWVWGVSNSQRLGRPVATAGGGRSKVKFDTDRTLGAGDAFRCTIPPTPMDSEEVRGVCRGLWVNTVFVPVILSKRKSPQLNSDVGSWHILRLMLRLVMLTG